MKKKILPFIIAIVLIFVVVGVSFGKQILDKYSYSKEVYDLVTYFENTSESDVAIILQNDFMPDRAYLVDGTYYVDLDFVHTYFNDRFYYEASDGLLIYTLPDSMNIASIGSTTVRYNDSDKDLGYIPFRIFEDKEIVALDYVKDYANFSYEAFENPGRIQIYTEWNDCTVAKVKKDTQVRHRGGVKSEILKEVKQGDKLTVIEQMDDWSKVKTEDAIIGFVENKRLTDIMPEMPIPVTTYVEPVYTNLCRDYKINMGWHAIAGIGGNSTLEDYVSNTKDLNVISPTWFRLTDSVGNFESFAEQSYVDKAHGMGLEVWALVENIEHSADVDMIALLESLSTREVLINNLINEVLTYGIDGINIDFEMLPSGAGKAFSEFIRELSVQCRANNIVLSVDNYVPIGNTGYYDRKTQGEVCDYVVIMGYDEHYAGSDEAGSVASIDYVDNGIAKTIEEVPAEKVINAIPLYTRIWTTNGTDVTSQAVEMPKVKEWIANHSLTPVWDEATCQNYAEFEDNEGLHQCWIEDSDSIKVKLNVMDKYNIGGVAEWRLGFETPEIWDVISEYVNGNGN